jgi:hypothetical protein
MDKTKFIYCLETEGNVAALMKILARLIRSRIEIEELQTVAGAEGSRKILIIVNDTRENSVMLLKKINGEVDVISVKLFEQTF